MVTIVVFTFCCLLGVAYAVHLWRSESTRQEWRRASRASWVGH